VHVPDGFINAPVSAVTAVVAAGAIAVSLRGARRELDEKTAPLAGLVAAFIFAVQMLNFPVAAGTSGHLLGGALAAILVGPFTGVLCVSVVLLMQGILFADGGLTALGVNITDMAIVTTVVSYAVFRGLVKVLPRKKRSITVAAFVSALLSVPGAAVAFTLIYALGGTTDVPITKVATAMIGVHVLIGIGEATITALTVGAVIAVRPDLVYGARGLQQRLKLRVGGDLVDAPAPAAVPVAARTSRRKVNTKKHHTEDSPLAGYGVKDISDARISGGLAGVIGVGVTVVAGTGIFWAVRRRRTADVSPSQVA
jgi:cobalt/nickel transport system permease protein